MPFTNSDILTAVDAAAVSQKPEERAIGHNLRWDERMGTARVAAFEQPDFLPSAANLPGFIEGYLRYFEDRLEWDGRKSVPEAFTDCNDEAGLSTLPDTNREVVRVVKIASPLKSAGLTFEQLDSALRMVRASSAGPTGPQLTHAEATLKSFVRKWNVYHRRPPAFVGFATDVTNELSSSDWPHALRDRFGIAHLHIPPGGGPIPIMLLRYKIRDILTGANPHCQNNRAIRVPTVLESNLYHYFYPSPSPFPYGRTVCLSGGVDEKMLTCEMIHLPIDLDTAHIDRIGWVTQPIPDVPLAQARNDHLFLLRYDTGRDDFGEDM